MIRAPARILRHRSFAGSMTRGPKHLGLGVLFVCLVLVFIGIFSYTRASMPARVYAASSTLNFQARLMNSSGALVPDGSYSIQFRLYDAANAGTNEWTETQTAVTVKNGYLSVQLGSVTPFGGSINWSQEKWLTMNVNGDGEMNPRIKLTANPYSFRSGQSDTLTDGSDTLTSDNLAQLAPSSVQVVNTALAALRINQTGVGLLAQLQGNGGDVFTIAKTGTITSAGSASFQGPALEIGTAAQSGGLVLNDGSSNNGTLQTAVLGSNRVYILPDAGGLVCLDSGNCLGGASGGANTALSNLVSTSINQSLIANANNSLDLGSSGLNWRSGYFGTGVVTPAVTSTGGLTISSGGGGDLTLDSASNILVIAATDTTLRRAAAGTYTIELNDSGTTTLALNNTGGVANLNLVDGGITTAGTLRLTNGGALQNITGLTIISGGASITGGLNNNSGGITNTGSITGVGTNITGTNGLTIASGGTGSLILNSASNTLVIAAGNTTIRRTAAGTTTIDLVDGDTTTLSLTNSGTGVANFNIDGSYQREGISGLNTLSCGNGQYVGGSSIRGGIVTAGTCQNDGLSDIAVKENIVSIGSRLDALKNVNIVNFDFKCEEPAYAGLSLECDRQIGVVAQQLEAVFPELVYTGSDGYKRVNLKGLNFYTLKAVGELSQTVDAAGNVAASSLKTGGTLRLSGSGALQNITGLTVISGGASIAGTTNINTGSNFATNINTGSSSGTVTIGGGSAALVINSTNFDVSAAGTLSGITTIVTSGDITSGGTFIGNNRSGITLARCANNQYIGNGVRVDDGLITSGACRSDGLSDQRLKTNIAGLDQGALEKIRQVNSVTFDFKCDEPRYANSGMDCVSGRQTGVIAQELAQIFPDLVYQDENGYYNVKYQGLSIYTLKSVDELAAKVDAISRDTVPEELNTGGQVRLTSDGELQNITGLKMIAGGASVVGGLDNNSGGISKAGEISGATKIEAESLTLNATATGNLLELEKDNQGVFTVFNNGALELKLDAANAFAVKKSTGDDVFSVNSDGGLVRIGSSTNDATAVLFVLDNVEMDGDPAGLNGAQYYNTTMNKFRCHQSNRWQNCLSAGPSEYLITGQRFSWNQPPNEAEIPAAPRVWADLISAGEFRMSMQVLSPGAQMAECQIQFATADAGPWFSLDHENKFIAINETGTLKTDWSKIKAHTFQEVILRAMCRGGNHSPANTGLAAKPEINNIRLQVR